VAKNIADEFASELVGNTVDLMRLAEGVRARVLNRLYQLRDELIEKLMALDGTENFSDREKRAKLTLVLRRTEATIRTAYKEMRDAHLLEMTSLAKLQAKFVPQMFTSILGVSVIDSVFTPEQFRAVARNSLVQGSPSAEWWARQATGVRQSFEDQMRMGYLQNETVGDLVRRVRGTATGKRTTVTIKGRRQTFPEFKGGIMSVATRNAEALVLTSVHSVSNDVLQQTYEGNDDIAKGLQAIATLDLRTTDICRARDRHAWYIEDYKPIPPTKEPWPGRPGYHWKCRTAMGVVLWSWEELAERAKSSKNARRIARKLDRSIDEGTRASMDGQVAKSLEYEDWLKSQSKERQLEVLGPGRYKLWKEKGLSFEQMVDQRGNPLTIAEIESRD
jgi:hypothetical protein